MILQPGTPRRRMTFRLRTLLIAVAALAVVAAVAAPSIQDRARRERARKQRAQLLEMGDYPGDIPLRPQLPLWPGAAPEPVR